MISFLLFLRIPHGDDLLPKTILTKEGVKIKDYVPEEQYNTYKPYADKFADKSSKVRPLPVSYTHLTLPTTERE